MKFNLFNFDFIEPLYKENQDHWVLKDAEGNLFPLSFSSELKAIEACLIISISETWLKNKGIKDD